MKLTRLATIALVMTTSLSLLGQSHAASSVTVDLRISSGAYVATRPTALTRGCAVAVPEGANGIAVLDAALATGCISSYKLETFGNGHFVSCIDRVCGDSAFFWAMYVNGAMTCYGVDDFRATQGKELAFSHENVSNAFIFAICL